MFGNLTIVSFNSLVDLEGEWHELETKRERAKRKERKNTT